MGYWFGPTLCKVQFVVSQTVVAVLYNDQCCAYVVAC